MKFTISALASFDRAMIFPDCVIAAEINALPSTRAVLIKGLIFSVMFAMVSVFQLKSISQASLVKAYFMDTSLIILSLVMRWISILIPLSTYDKIAFIVISGEAVSFTIKEFFDNKNLIPNLSLFIVKYVDASLPIQSALVVKVIL